MKTLSRLLPRTAAALDAARAAFPADDVWAAVERVEAYASVLPSLAEVAVAVRDDLRGVLAGERPAPINRRRIAPVFRRRAGASQSADRRVA